jgi:ferredoxin--NADP+ reductase
MYTIIAKQNLSLTIRRLDIKADGLVSKLKPGHFVTITLEPGARPVPFNIFEIDWRRKCLSIVFEETDALTVRLGELRINDKVHAVSGPFGLSVPLEKKGTIICVGEGLGMASLLNLARGLKQVGNKVIGIAGFETKKTSLFESQLRLHCNKFYVMYKDGMHERKGDVLTPLRKVLKDEPVARIYAEASPETLAAIRLIAAEQGIPVFVNIMGFIHANGVFYENSSIILGGRRYFPAIEGVIIDAQALDLKEAGRAVVSQREYFECRKKELASLHQQSVFARLKKLFWA